MTTVELLYFPGCPNVSAARDQLRRAFTAIGRPASWTEIDISADSAPAHTRGYGSPTVLVDGRDVTGDDPADGTSCRIYGESDVQGVPPLEAIISALRSASTAITPPGAGMSLAVVPGALLSLLPVVGCASCWPAYAGVLGALGMPFLMDTKWLLPITGGALLVALAGLGYRARQRRGRGPLALGALAATVLLVGKFVLEVEPVVYIGTPLLVAASLWNAWPKRDPRRDAYGCAPREIRSPSPASKPEV
jgi:mercuric ion transport protein